MQTESKSLRYRTVNLDQETYEAASRLAAGDDRSLVSVVRRAIDLYAAQSTATVELQPDHAIVTRPGRAPYRVEAADGVFAHLRTEGAKTIKIIWPDGSRGIALDVMGPQAAK